MFLSLNDKDKNITAETNENRMLWIRTLQSRTCAFQLLLVCGAKDSTDQMA